MVRVNTCCRHLNGALLVGTVPGALVTHSSVEVEALGDVNRYVDEK